LELECHEFISLEIFSHECCGVSPSRVCFACTHTSISHFAFIIAPVLPHLHCHFHLSCHHSQQGHCHAGMVDSQPVAMLHHQDSLLAFGKIARLSLLKQASNDKLLPQGCFKVLESLTASWCFSCTQQRGAVHTQEDTHSH